MNVAGDSLVFVAEHAEAPANAYAPTPWQVLVVDDDPDVHETTEFALSGLSVRDRPFKLLHAHSAAEALRQIRAQRDIAVVLLDVVMETVTAGLDLVLAIRKDLGITDTRIILRTGQPGHAPDVETVRRFDINDYHTKSELTRSRLYVALSTAIRTYEQLQANTARQRFLQQVVSASQRLIAQPSLRAYAAALLGEAGAILGCPVDGIVCSVPGASDEGGTITVLAGTGRHAELAGGALDAEGDVSLAAIVRDCAAAKEGALGTGGLTLFLPGTHDQRALVACLQPREPLPTIGRDLFEILCSNIALAAEKVALTERLHLQAFFDALVALPNRNAFIEALDGCLGAGKGGGKVLALVDIDQFAEINDMFGHGYGDRVLQAIAGRLQRAVGDECLVARVGSDTFGILGAEQLLAPERLLEEFSRPLTPEGNEHFVSVAIGMVRLTEPGGSGVDRLKDASIAVKHAKASGHGQVAWFTPEVGIDSRARTRLIQALRDAFSRDRLFLAYQPQVELETGRVVGFEALLRWRTDDGRLVPPDTFIPVAENSGLIVNLGAWILRSALDAADRLRDTGLAGFRMAVNVSVVQFRHPDFLATIDAALAATGSRPQDLELEITESVAMMGAESIGATIAALKARGIAVAIDDFGTGFSSLSYLDRLPADRVKIDRSFVSALDSDQRGARIAEMVIPLGRMLGMKVLAEGVETDAQVARLRKLGCHEAQGYHFCRPLPLAEALDWVHARLGSTG